eukprot:12886237-Prorocentrum_lima.AAC.1
MQRSLGRKSKCTSKTASKGKHGWIWLGAGTSTTVTRAYQQHQVGQMVLTSKRRGRQAGGRKPPWSAPG